MSRPERFVARVPLPAPAAEAFAWHARPGALERLAPPWSPVTVLERAGGIENGGRVVLGIPMGPFRVRWVAEHDDYVPGRRFRDTQRSGPFAQWVHTHRIEPLGHDRSELEDEVVWALPLAPIGPLVGGWAVRDLLERLFRHRHRVTADDLAAHAPCRTRAHSVAVSGASGLIGSALVPFLTTGGHTVARLVRRGPSTADAIAWDPDAGTIDAARLDGLDAVVHLAGTSIADGRWTDARKAAILASRTRSTRLLAETLAGLASPPRVFVCASAIGIYGDRGEESLDESSAPGSGFLAEVCRAWEAAAEPAARRGIRVVHLRFGVVLTPAGGALAQLLLPARLGLGGPLGSGRQVVSWVAIDDVLGAIHHAVVDDRLAGPVNVVAPEAVTNAELARTLASVLGRPALLPVPAWAARLAFGELADEALLASARVRPGRLLDSGYAFRTPVLADALAHVLGT